MCDVWHNTCESRSGLSMLVFGRRHQKVFDDWISELTSSVSIVSRSKKKVEDYCDTWNFRFSTSSSCYVDVFHWKLETFHKIVPIEILTKAISKFSWFQWLIPLTLRWSCMQQPDEWSNQKPLVIDFKSNFISIFGWVVNSHDTENVSGQSWNKLFLTFSSTEKWVKRVLESVSVEARVKLQIANWFWNRSSLEFRKYIQQVFTIFRLSDSMWKTLFEYFKLISLTNRHEKLSSSSLSLRLPLNSLNSNIIILFVLINDADDEIALFYFSSESFMWKFLWEFSKLNLNNFHLYRAESDTHYNYTIARESLTASSSSLSFPHFFTPLKLLNVWLYKIEMWKVFIVW